MADRLQTVPSTTLQIRLWVAQRGAGGLGGSVEFDGRAEVAVEGGKERFQVCEGGGHDGVVHGGLGADDGGCDREGEVGGGGEGHA